MIAKTEIELQRAQMVKALRSTIRLKHALAADRELNEVLPEAVKEFDKQVAHGQLLEAEDIEAIVREVAG